MEKWLDGDNGWAISIELFNYIKENLPVGSTILSMGSGLGDKYLIEAGYKMISIEQDKKYMNLYHNNYIYAPIVNKYFDMEIVIDAIKDIDYDLVLVDAPTKASGGRMGFINLEYLIKDVPVIFDDVNRVDDMNVALEWQKMRDTNIEIIGTTKQFAICE